MTPDAARPDPLAIDTRAVRRAFGRAARTYDEAAVLQREVGERMATRLDVVKLVPAAILDAGCGTGEALVALAKRYPHARRIGVDVALPMLALAERRGGESATRLGHWFDRVRGIASPARFIAADIGALPLASGAFDLVYSNLVLQWVDDLPRAFGELRRVLKIGGLLSFTTFGPDTLKELRAAFAGVDGHTHVGRFVDMHDIGDLLVHAGFADPVMEMEYLTLTYTDAAALMRDLRAIGATNATRGRPRGLMGRRRFAEACAALEAHAREGRIPATFEVIYGHAWKAAPKRTAEGLPILSFERRERGGG